MEQEVEKNKALAEALQTLATEQHQLQQSLCRSGRSSTLSILNEDDFFDAVSGQRLLTKHLVLFFSAVFCSARGLFVKSDIRANIQAQFMKKLRLNEILLHVFSLYHSCIY